MKIVNILVVPLMGICHFSLSMDASQFNTLLVDQIVPRFESINQQEDGSREETGDQLQELDSQFYFNYSSARGDNKDLIDANEGYTFYETYASLSYGSESDQRFSMAIGHSAIYTEGPRKVQNFVFDCDEFVTTNVEMMHQKKFNSNWGLFAGGGFIFSDGNGSLQQDSEDYFGFIGASYEFGSNFSAMAGISASSYDAGNEPYVPMLMLNWNINERNRLSVGRGLHYQYAITKDWRNVFGISIELFEINVQENNQWGAVGRYVENPVRVISHSSLNLSYAHHFENGLVVWAKVSLNDESYNELYAEHDRIYRYITDPGISYSFGMNHRF